MTGKTKRRSLLRRAAKFALAGAMSITAASAHWVDENPEPLQVTVPERVKSGEPFTLRVSVPEVDFSGEETLWFEAWLGREYLGRFEIANPTINASLTITIALTRSTTLRVRDFYGRTIVKKLLVV